MRKVLFIFATGLIFCLVSEGLFYGLVRREDSFFGYMTMAALYGCAAWLFLIVVTYFNVKSKAALFVAAGFFGWMVEGALLNTTYGVPDMPFPLSIPVTALSWHALVTVMFGLYATRLALRKRGSIFRFAILTGIFWGIWAATWRSADATIQIGAEMFFLYGCLLIALFVAGHLIWERMARTPLEFGKGEIWTAIVGTTLWFLAVTVPLRPIAIFVLPPLLVLMYFVLQKNKTRERSGSLLPELADDIPLSRYLPFAMVPPIASVIYAFTATIPNLEYTMVAVTAITGCVGTWMFVASVVRLLKS